MGEHAGGYGEDVGEFALLDLVEDGVGGEAVFEAVEGAGFIDEFFGVDFMCMDQTAGADEFDDMTEGVAVEPDAVFVADIDDDAGAVGEVEAVHELGALRAGEVFDVLVEGEVGGGGLIGEAGVDLEGGLLLLVVVADFGEGCGGEPEAGALGTFEDVGVFELGGEHFDGVAAGTIEVGGDVVGGAEGFATVGAEFAADEGEAEARGAGDGFEARFAVLALGGIGGDGGAAGGAVERCRGHIGSG